MDEAVTLTLTYAQIIKLICDIGIIVLAVIMMMTKNGNSENKQVKLLLVMIAAISGIILAFGWSYTHVVAAILTTITGGANITLACIAITARKDAKPEDTNYFRAGMIIIGITVIMMIIHMF